MIQLIIIVLEEVDRCSSTSNCYHLVEGVELWVVEPKLFVVVESNDFERLVAKTPVD